MIHTLSFLLSSLILLATGEGGDPVEKKIVTIKGNHPANMKTTNGCGVVTSFIINRGDSASNIPATIGCINFDQQDYTYVSLDTLPTYWLLDFCFPLVDEQTFFNNSNDPKHFVAVTSEYIYLYSTIPDFSIPQISRIDSVPTSIDFIAAYIYCNLELLVVNQIDSINYTYLFYDLPTLVLDTQMIISINPKKINTFYDGGFYFLIGGDSLGVSRLITINTDGHLIEDNVTLDSLSSNPKELQDAADRYRILSSPGDSAIYLIEVIKSNYSVTSIPILTTSGINVSTKTGIQSNFCFQLNSDTGSLAIDKQVLIYDPGNQEFDDTLYLNRRIHSLFGGANNSFFGPNISIIGGILDTIINDTAFYYSDFSFLPNYLVAGATPTWFAEDYRCYTSVEEIEQNLSIDVYPNPASDEVQILVQHLASGKTYRFDVTDINGKILWSEDIIAKQNYTVPLQDFPSGVLILRVDAGTKVVTRKIIKQ